ncbi:serine/threonine protein kinase [Pendulispora brunnea]|uniref:Serine/threonine protein kinase n=1 Tax=Pendulispora brunnea TaxID=2905690 RepID=A0ABZ2K989_9BACT
MSASDPLGMIGQVLHGQFRVDDLVEDGKRHFLYRGVHLMLEVPIAIKCMKAPPGGSHDQFIRRFRHESRLHYKLSQASPHVVRVLASGTAMAPAGEQQLTPFMVLEWLEGESLAQDIANRRAQGLPGRTLAEAIRLLDPPVEALAFAHTQGIVHREVTPETLFCARVGGGTHVKLLDFGVAKILTERALDLAPPSQSMGLVPIGAPGYAAPEQYSSSIGTVGPWTDVYAITLVLLEMMLNRPVMEEGPIPLGVRVLDPKHRPTPRALGLEVSDRVEAVLAQAVAARPENRQQEAGELWGMLKNALMRDQDSLQRVSKLPVTEVPRLTDPLLTETGPEMPTAALLLLNERERITLAEDQRDTLSGRDSITVRRLEEQALRMARAAADAAPETPREPPTMVVHEEELSYDDLGAKTVERSALPRAIVDAQVTSGMREALAQPPTPRFNDDLPPPSMEERTVVMQADELMTIANAPQPVLPPPPMPPAAPGVLPDFRQPMDSAEPVAREGELFVGADTLDAKTMDVAAADITAKNPDTTTVSPVKAPAAPPRPPPVVPNMGATWPMTQPQGAVPAGPGTPAPFPFPPTAPMTGQAPAVGQMMAPGQQYMPMPQPGAQAGQLGQPGQPGQAAPKKEAVSVAVVAVLLVLGLVVAVGAALYVAHQLGWI